MRHRESLDPAAIAVLSCCRFTIIDYHKLCAVIQTFADEATDDIWHGRATNKSRPYGSIAGTCRRKLQMLDAANTLLALAQPPGNRLKKLHGKRSQLHAIRINDQYRIVFAWKDGHAYNVQITDYH